MYEYLVTAIHPDHGLPIGHRSAAVVGWRACEAESQSRSKRSLVEMIGDFRRLVRRPRRYWADGEGRVCYGRRGHRHNPERRAELAGQFGTWRLPARAIAHSAILHRIAH